MDLSSVRSRGIHLRSFVYTLSELRCEIMSPLPVPASSVLSNSSNFSSYSHVVWIPTATLSNHLQRDFTYSFRLGSVFFKEFFAGTVLYIISSSHLCPACRTYLIATRFWVVVICPIIKCLTVLEFYFILFDLCLFITIFNFILNYVPIVTFWIFTYHKIWILLIIFCFIWNYWIIMFLTCLEVFWNVVS